MRLDHDGAAAVAPALADAMTHTTDAGQLFGLAQGLAGALDHLSPEERVAPARIAALALADAMPAAAAHARASAERAPKAGGLRPGDYAASALGTIARSLHLMLTRLPAPEVAGPAHDAARVLTGALPAAVLDSQVMPNVSFGLQDVADGLDPAGAADAARTLMGLAVQVTDLNQSSPLGDALEAVAGRLDRAAAAPAAAALSEAMNKSANPYTIGVDARDSAPPWVGCRRRRPPRRPWPPPAS